MFERFTDRARRVKVLADEEALNHGHCHVGTGHLAIGLMAEGEGIAYQVLGALGVTEAALREAVLDRVRDVRAGPAGHLDFTPRLKKVLELALREALQLGCTYIGTEHLLLGLVREGEGTGVKALASLGVEGAAVRAEVLKFLHGNARPGDAARSYQATVHETALGAIRLGHGKHGVHAVIVGPQECVHRISSAEAREAAAALAAVAGDIDAASAGASGS